MKIESSRYLEEDLNGFLQELIDNKRFNNSKEEGITKAVIAQGFNSLSPPQKFVFEKALDHFVISKCSRCNEDIPWCEMSAAEDNGKVCSWCQQLGRKDN